jgi:outer membrane protein assembly factor BamE (lipoprotein component of BamABCDE complex)
MRHDSHCLLAEHDTHAGEYWCDSDCERECICEIIARVRDDERSRVVVEFMSNHRERETYETALQDAAVAAGNQRSKFKAATGTTLQTQLLVQLKHYQILRQG